MNASLTQRIVIFALQAISRQYGHAIALTSANQSGTPSTLSVHEFSSLWDEVCVCSCPTALRVSIGIPTFVRYVTFLPLSQCALVFDGGSIVSSEHTVPLSANLGLHDTNQHQPILHRSLGFYDR